MMLNYLIVLLVIVAHPAASILEICFYHDATEGNYIQCGNFKVYQTTQPSERLEKIDGIQIGWNTTLNYLQYGLFTAFVNLKRLSLENSNIEKVDLRAFYGMSHLEDLNFFNNRIAAIEPGTFNQLYNLRYLDLGHNELENLSDNLFASLTNLQQLSLKFNKITKVTKDTFTGLQFLRELNLAGNQLSHLPNDVFEDFSQLENLDLGFNRIQNIPQNIFMYQFSLIKLNLESNEIQQLPVDFLQNTTHLQYLDVSNNLLEGFSSDILNNTAVEMLNLERNELTEIDGEKLLEKAEWLDHIYLDHNPWNCELLKQTLMDFEESHLYFRKGEDFDATNQVFGIKCNP